LNDYIKARNDYSSCNAMLALEGGVRANWSAFYRPFYGNPGPQDLIRTDQ